MSTVLSRRRMLGVAVVSFGLLAPNGRSGTARVLTQGDEPAADADLLFSAVVEDLPAPPALVRLVRIALDPGAALPRQSADGPAFGLVERGVLSLQVEGEAIVSRLERDGTPAQALVPDAAAPLDLRPGDQAAIPAGVPFALVNGGEEAAAFLAAFVVPATRGGPETMPPMMGTPVPGTGGAANVAVLGEAVASGWPAPPFLVQLDRVNVAPGEPVPGFPGPVLLAVEQGTFGFALLGGEIQAAGSDPGTAVAADGEAVYRIAAGEAIFFAGGVNAIPRGEDESDLTLLRFGVTAIPQDGEAASAASTTGDAPAADLPTGTPSAAVTRSDDAGPAGEERVRVAVDGVRLRSSPSTGGDVVAELAEGVEVVVTGDPIQSEGLRWLPVRVADDPATAGYIAELFVEPLA